MAIFSSFLCVYQSVNPYFSPVFILKSLWNQHFAGWNPSRRSRWRSSASPWTASVTAAPASQQAGAGNAREKGKKKKQEKPWPMPSKIIPGYQLGYGWLWNIFFGISFKEYFFQGVGIRFCMLEFENHDPPPLRYPRIIRFWNKFR